MSNLISGNHKHLTLDNRTYIEEALNGARSFQAISKYLCKDPSAISDEVFKNRIANSWNWRGSFNNPYNFCIHRFLCRKTNACKKLFCDTHCRFCHIYNKVCDCFELEQCKRISKAPFACNGCDKPTNSSLYRPGQALTCLRRNCMRLTLWLGL